jgi:hypothetical protein
LRSIEEEESQLASGEAEDTDDELDELGREEEEVDRLEDGIEDDEDEEDPSPLEPGTNPSPTEEGFEDDDDEEEDEEQYEDEGVEADITPYELRPDCDGDASTLTVCLTTPGSVRFH